MNLITSEKEVYHKDDWETDSTRKTTIETAALPAKATYTKREKK